MRADATHAATPARRGRLGQWWHGLARPTRVAIVIALVVGLIAVIALATDAATDDATGGDIAFSAYSDADSGVGAYAELLDRYGYSVAIRRGAFDDALDAAATVVLFQPDRLSEADATALRVFVRRGGRLLTGGSDPDWLDVFLTDPPAWSPNGRAEWTQVSELLAPVDTIEAAAIGSFTTGVADRAIVAEGPLTLAYVQPYGAGRIIAVADISPFANRYLDRADNAAFALALADADGDAVGEDERVVFVERFSGVNEPPTGLDALPAAWRTALLLLAVAALLYLWSKLRRLGVPELPDRPLPPPRSRYVDSLAGSLTRADQPRVVADRLRAQIHASIIERWPEARIDADAYRAAARAAGLTDHEIDVVVAPDGARSGADLVVVARCAARLERQEATR